jgi:hypothetical protein
VRWVRIEGAALATDHVGTVCADVAGLVAAETDSGERGWSVGHGRSKVSAAIMKLRLVEEEEGVITTYSSSSSSKEGASPTAVGIGGEGRLSRSSSKVNLVDGTAGWVSRYSSTGIFFEVCSLVDDGTSGSLRYSSKVIFFLFGLGAFDGFSGREFRLDVGTIEVE